MKQHQLSFNFDHAQAPSAEREGLARPAHPPVHALGPVWPGTGQASPRVDDLAAAAGIVKVKLEGRVRADVMSALNTLARALDQDLAQLPADPAALRVLLEQCDPLLKGISLGRWTKVRQHLGIALRTCGLEAFQARQTAPLSEHWLSLLSTSGLKRPYGLQRMLKFFGEQDIEPGDVEVAHLEQFRTELLRTSLMPKPEAAWRDAVRLWNKARENSAAWPQVVLKVEPEKRVLSLPWDTFPPSFVSDVEAFIGQQDGSIHDFVFKKVARPVAPSTADHRRKLLRLVASAYHHATGLGGELKCLATLVELERAQMALTQLKAMQGGLRPTTLHAAELLLNVARSWVKANKEDIEDLKIAIGNWRDALDRENPVKGMRPKNRERLRQLDDPQKRAALYGLPEKVHRNVSAKLEPTYRDARRLMFAVALEILLVAPLRLHNLVSLEIGRHLQWRARGDKMYRLLIPSAEIKWRGEPIDVDLNRHSSALIRDFVTNFRSLITSNPTSFLFPNASGSARNDDAFSSALSKFVSREVGLRLHSHLFRGVALKTLLEARPEALDQARRLLGHRNVATTEKHYIQLQNARAFAEFGALVGEARSRAGGRRGWGR